MHELSIAMSIVDIAEEEVKKANANKVKEISLEIGEMSGVIIEAMEFAMEEAVKNSVLENAERNFISIPGIAKCNSCETEFEVSDLYTPCPCCNGFQSDIIKGKELKVKSLKVE